jgi:hypothetical protein
MNEAFLGAALYCVTFSGQSILHWAKVSFLVIKTVVVGVKHCQALLSRLTSPSIILSILLTCCFSNKVDQAVYAHRLWLYT